MIPLVDLKAQYVSIKPEIDEAIGRVLTNASFVLGTEVSEFEDAFADYCDAAYAVGVASGTAALHLALSASGVGPGDEVITTPLTFIATAEAISYVGARPVFADVDPVTLNLEPSRVEAAITARTKAVMPVHLYGQPADMDPLLELGRIHNLAVIEDAAQAHGAEYKGRRVGQLGDLGCFSFYPAKNLGAYGDGGMVVSNDAELAERIRMLRDHGRKSKYEHEFIGYGERLDALQAAILRVKLRHLDEWNELRRTAAHRYAEMLPPDRVTFPCEAEWTRPVYYMYVVRVPARDSVLNRLTASGIGAGVHYPVPLHLQPAYAHMGHARGDYPNTEQAADEVLSLPLFPEITEDQQSWVVEALCDAVAETRG